MTEIEIIIKKGGKTTINVKGGRGASCVDLTKALEKALGETTHDVRKAEFYEPPEPLRRFVGS